MSNPAVVPQLQTSSYPLPVQSHADRAGLRVLHDVGQSLSAMRYAQPYLSGSRVVSLLAFTSASSILRSIVRDGSKWSPRDCSAATSPVEVWTVEAVADGADLVVQQVRQSLTQLPAPRPVRSAVRCARSLQSCSTMISCSERSRGAGGLCLPHELLGSYILCRDLSVLLPCRAPHAPPVPFCCLALRNVPR